MKRTVTALYETREEADRVATSLKAQGLGGEVQILDADHDDAKKPGHGLKGWLSGVFAGHHDHHIYAEGLSRGHFLLLAKVDDLNETRAATIMDAAAAVDLDAIAAATPGATPATTDAAKRASHHTFQSPGAPSTGDMGGGGYASTFGGVRSYTL